MEADSTYVHALLAMSISYAEGAMHFALMGGKSDLSGSLEELVKKIKAKWDKEIYDDGLREDVICALSVAKKVFPDLSNEDDMYFHTTVEDF